MAEQGLRFEGVFNTFLKLIAIGFAIVEILYLLGYIPPNLWRLESFALICIFMLAYSTRISKAYRDKKPGVLASNILLMVVGVVSCIYLLIEIPRMEWYYGSVWTSMDIVMATFLTISLLDITQKEYGWSLSICAVVFLLYTFFGNLLPDYLFQHTGFTYERTMSFMFGPGGIFGITMSTFVNIIFVYMLFGTFLNKTGVGKFLVDLSFAVAGRWRGGPAKVAVIASAILGTINGNSVANVATIGAFTIPLMKRTGYKPVFAGAVEAAASTGGQILPPVMGAGAFIMAEFLQIGYQEVVIAAILPALLYFIGVYFMVDLEAVKENLKGVEDTPSVRELLKSGSFLLLPLVVLVYALLVENMSVTRAGILAIVCSVVVSWFTKDHKMGIKEIIDAMIEGTKSAAGIGAMCATAGIVVGTVAITGFGNLFSSTILNLAGENLLLVAVLTAVITIILGMGLPTTASYIIGMSVAVPALVALNVPALSAHLFVFYFAVVSAITPPVGAAYFTGAAIAEAPVMATGWQSVRIGIGAFTVPFFFILSPVLLLQGSPIEIVITIITSLLGMASVTMALQKVTFTGTGLNWWQCFMLYIAFVLLVYPTATTWIAGIFLVGVSLLFTSKFFRKGESSLPDVQEKQIINK